LKRTDPLREAIDAAVGARPIESLPVRFAAVASDAASGETVLLDRGAAGAAVAASSAVPVWFEPVPIDGRDLLDGSLTAPVPVDAARALGADVVVAVDVAYRPHEAPALWLADLGFQAIHILTNALAREQTRRADFTLRLDLHRLMSQRMDPRALIDAGERALIEIAPAVRRALA
jgi:NTE family protein